MRTDEEYRAWGFTEEEIPMIRRHDKLITAYKNDCITAEEKEEMFDLVEKLGL